MNTEILQEKSIKNTIEMPTYPACSCINYFTLFTLLPTALPIVFFYEFLNVFDLAALCPLHIECHRDCTVMALSHVEVYCQIEVRSERPGRWLGIQMKDCLSLHRQKQCSVSYSV